ncbi:hypothetical protein AB0E08_24280 [Streptomyces sp. NPDC048281]|uniref:hypothetical protein n=1 Tax=Streptomyces sp. NPDC048281 TaxID=3154715 RepID=UPI0034462036
MRTALAAQPTWRLPGLGADLARTARQFTDRTAYAGAALGHPVAPSAPVPDVAHRSRPRPEPSAGPWDGT